MGTTQAGACLLPRAYKRCAGKVCPELAGLRTMPVQDQPKPEDQEKPVLQVCQGSGFHCGSEGLEDAHASHEQAARNHQYG